MDMRFGTWNVRSMYRAYSLGVVAEDEMGRACSTNGEKRNAYRVLVGKPNGKRPPGRPIRRWVDNIKIYLREIGWNGRDWIDLAQDRDQWSLL
jgi:hypothetical protein